MSYPPPSHPPGYGPPPGFAPGYGHPPGPAADPRAGTTNGFAVASLVLGILAPCGGGLLSVIFGFVALSQIKRRQQRGRGMAIAGIVATAVWLAAGVTLLVIALSTSASRDDAGEITSPGRVSTTSLSPGDCIEELSDAETVFSLPAVPCAEPHQGEVFAIFTLPDGDWPGEDAVAADAEDGCVDELYGYSPSAYDDQQVDIYYLLPTRTTWRSGDREVVCITYYLDGQRTGSIRE